MAENGVWGGDFEMYILAYMLDIYSYQADNNYWLGCFPHKSAFIVYFLEMQPFPGSHRCEEKAYILKGCLGT